MEKQKSHQLVLDKKWKLVKQTYSLTRVLGEGSYGMVVKGRHRLTKQIVAIKMIKFEFDNIHLIRNVIREISILRQLSQMPNNLFTITLKDVICPVDINNNVEVMAKFNHIFVVTDYIETDI